MCYEKAIHGRSRGAVRVALAAALLLVCAAPGVEGKAPAPTKASFNFRSTEPELVLSTLKELYDVEFVSEVEIAEPLTVNSRGAVTAERMVEILAAELKSQGAVARLEGETIRIMPVSLAAAKVELIHLSHSSPTEVAEIVNDMFQTPDLLRETTTDNAEMVRALLEKMDRHGSALLSGRMKVTAVPYPRLRAVIVRAPEIHMAAIREFIQTTLDRPTPKPKPRPKPKPKPKPKPRPPDPSMLKVAGEAAYAAGDERQALLLLQEAYRGMPAFDPKLANLLMKLYIKRGMTRQAEQIVQRFLSQPGQEHSPTALLALARLEADSRDYKKALQHVEQVLKAQPDNKEAQDLKLAVTAVTAGEEPWLPSSLEINERTSRLMLERAAAIWLEGRRLQAVAMVETLHAKRPEDPEIAGKLATMYMQSGRPEDARAVLARTAAKHPEAAPEPPAEGDTIDGGDGDDEIAPDDPAERLRFHRSLLDEPDPRKRYERHLEYVGRIEDPLRRALEQANVAALYDMQEDYLAFLRQAARLDPSAPGVVERLFRHAVNTRDWEQAQTWVEVAREANLDGADGRLYASRLTAAQDVFRPAEDKVDAGPKEERRVYRLDYVPADYIVKTARSLLRLSAYAEKRINAVIFTSDEPEQFEQLEELIAMLDVPESQDLETYHVRLNNATSREVRNILDQLYRGGPSLPFTPEGLADLSEEEFAAQVEEAAGALTEAGVDEEVAREFVTGGLGMAVGRVQIIEDSLNNALLIRTHPRNIDPIMKVIQELDRPRGQVMIKVLIAEVTLDDTAETGIDWMYQDLHKTGRNEWNMDLNVDAASTGLTYTYISDNIETFVRLIKTSTRLNVLSRPQVLTLDNQEAKIEFGKKVPLLQTTKVTAEGSTNSTVRYEPVTTRLLVTPHVNAAGFIRLDIDQRIDDTSPDTFAITEQLAPRILVTRHATTHVQVRDGQTVCLGGFVGDTIDETDTMVPLLGEIPGLGYLFSQRDRNRVKTELLIFITPYILRTPEELLSMTNDIRSKAVGSRDPDRPSEELDYRPALTPNPHHGWMRNTRRYTIPDGARRRGKDGPADAPAPAAPEGPEELPEPTPLRKEPRRPVIERLPVPRD